MVAAFAQDHDWAGLKLVARADRNFHADTGLLKANATRRILMHNAEPADIPGDSDDIIYPSAIPFVLLHLACIGVFFTNVTLASATLGLLLYGVRMFAVGAAYHRYFSHRSYSTSRLLQFLLAILAQSSAQKSVLWWASKHRQHHRHADTPDDTHSPSHHGFAYAHLGWIFSAKHHGYNLQNVKDLTAFPELVWLDRFELLPAIVLAALSFAILGWSGLIVGFVCSTVVLYHATFAINSIAHTLGSRRYLTGDNSRNNWFLALLTFGEGWHNNHHAFQSSARQGFRWWEIDLTFWCLKALASVGLVWNLKAPPRSVLRNEQRLSPDRLEKVATMLAKSFDHDQRPPNAASSTENALAWLPSHTALRQRAAVMFAKSPSMDEVVERAHALIRSSFHKGLENCR